MTLGDLLIGAVERFGANEALVFPDNRLSYRQLANQAREHAQSLLALGIKPGDHVGILMPNCPAYIELLFGIALVGGVAVPVNARYKAEELAYVVENADLIGLVTSSLASEYVDFAGLLHEAFPNRPGASPRRSVADRNSDSLPTTEAFGGIAQASDPRRLQSPRRSLRNARGIAQAPNPRYLQLVGAPLLRFITRIGDATPAGFLPWSAFRQAAAHVSPGLVEERRRAVMPTDAAIMMYTSGTTSNPKGCPLAHDKLVRNGANMNRERYFLNEKDRFWAPLPMFHMAAILPLLACFDAGCALLSMNRVEAGAALEMMERERVTVAFPAFPTVTNELITHPRFATTDLSGLRRINNVAPLEMLRRFQEAFPQAVQTGAYGMTELTGVISYNHPEEDLETRLTTCGQPFSGISVKIVDPDTCKELPVGEKGEIWVRGYALFDGYYKSPEKNAESFVDGWFRTGDLCSVDDKGRIVYHGRIKDMLKVGGENVAAVEIESFLATHPAVKLAQVIGVPDARLLEVAAAFIELEEGAEATEQEIIDHCRGRIASFKVPRHVRFVDEWPMSSTKVQKFKLRELFDASLGS